MALSLSRKLSYKSAHTSGQAGGMWKAPAQSFTDAKLPVSWPVGQGLLAQFYR